MFEVIVTCRPDFREEVVERCPGLEEARAVAERLSMRSEQFTASNFGKASIMLSIPVTL